MEWICCPLCSNDGGERRYQEGDYVTVRCPSCDLVYQNPRPSPQELWEAYQTYLPEGEDEIEAWGRMMESVFRKGADLIERSIPQGRILDVGAGYGFFLALMKARGWEVTGVEVSSTGVRYGRDRWGLPLLPQPWETISFKEGEFDVVTAFYVLEHLPAPLAFLKEVHRILRPGGMILVRYPHTTPIKAVLSLLMIRNHLYHLPFHLVDFAPGTMRRALKEAGFEGIENFVGGFTAPPALGSRLATYLFGTMAEILHRLSWGKILLPGVSKTTTARKGGP